MTAFLANGSHGAISMDPTYEYLPVWLFAITLLHGEPNCCRNCLMGDLFPGCIYIYHKINHYTYQDKFYPFYTLYIIHSGPLPSNLNKHLSWVVPFVVPRKKWKYNPNPKSTMKAQTCGLVSNGWFNDHAALSLIWMWSHVASRGFVSLKPTGSYCCSHEICPNPKNKPTGWNHVGYVRIPESLTQSPCRHPSVHWGPGHSPKHPTPVGRVRLAHIRPTLSIVRKLHGWKFHYRLYRWAF
jgi:hypothetical protein